MEPVRESGSSIRDKRESLPENDEVRDMGAEGGPSSSPRLANLNGGELGSYLESTCTPPGVGTRVVERADVTAEEERKLSNGEYGGACRELADVVRDTEDKREEERELESLAETMDDGALGGLPTPFPPREGIPGCEVSLGE